MASPFSLPSKGKVGRDEYAKLIAQETKRYPNDRDQAVRAANVAAGFGNSTAQRFMHGGGAAKADPQKTASTGKAKPIATPTPRMRTPESAPIPQARPTQFPPDLAVSPPRGDMMWPGATSGPSMPSPINVAGVATQSMPQSIVAPPPPRSMPPSPSAGLQPPMAGLFPQSPDFMKFMQMLLSQKQQAPGASPVRGLPLVG